MKFLRKGFTKRGISTLLLIVFIQSIFTPYYSYALTSGPLQPEFITYQSPGATDMVNLVTGDFGYEMPLLEVPGPEGNFALPLTYRGGIKLEAESSWCGLGFNINPGSLVRNVNEYPDDASGEASYVTVQNLTPITGWNRVWNHPYTDDWNSETGHHGNVNLLDIVEVDFGTHQKTNVGIAGVHFSNHVTFDPVQFVNAAMSILSFGMDSEASMIESMAKQGAIAMTLNTAVAFSMPINAPGSMGSGAYKLNRKTSRSSLEFHRVGTLLSGLPMISKKKSWKQWLDATRKEKMYGTLYLGNVTDKISAGLQFQINGKGNWNSMEFSNTDFSGAPSEGPASDINFTMDDLHDYFTQSPASVLATDAFAVNAPGISGSIKPYRMEIGSVAMPATMGQYFTRWMPVSYQNYHVPFVYEGSTSNQYTYHTGDYKQDYSDQSYGLDTANYNKGYLLKFNDKIVQGQYYETIYGSVRADLDSARKVPQANNIDWFSNSDLQNTLGSQQFPAGFIDFLSNQGSNSDRFNFRTPLVSNSTVPYVMTFRTTMASYTAKIPVNDPAFLSLVNVNDYVDITVTPPVPGAVATYHAMITAKDASSITTGTLGVNNQYNGLAVTLDIGRTMYPTMSNGIGGFCITGADGTMYHFALPVYNYDDKTESIDQSDPNKRTMTTRYTPCATTWLLTAITGSDFVDRNQNGIADDGDWGYWVKMNYGRYAASTDYDWRLPFSGEVVDPSGQFRSYQKGKRQLYYLNSIETRSHVALFMKGVRDDGKSASMTVAPLRLEEICLLKKEQYKKLNTSFGIGEFSNKVNTLCLSSQFTPTPVRDYVNRNCVKRIVFGYDYTLCNHTPNSGTTSSPEGKLTLKTISIKGRNDVNVVPDYKFQYSSFNPDYNANYWDGWGMYDPSGITLNHKADDATGANGAAWSLTSIQTPSGADIVVNYERDDYGSIAGESLPNYGFSNSYSSYVPPTGITTIQVNHNNFFRAGDKVDLINGNISYTCPSNGYVANEPFSGSGLVIQSATPTSITLTNAIARSTNCTSPTTVTYTGSLKKTIPLKTGGDIRVSSIIVKDDFTKQNKIRYLYTNDDGSSSGVVSREPEYIKEVDFPFYDNLRYPETPVMYGKVSVLTGNLTNDQDYYTKQVFEFQTPNESDVTAQIIDKGSYGSQRSKTKKLIKIEDRKSKIGVLKAITIKDNANNIVSQTKMIYTDKLTNDGAYNGQGVYSEGTLLTDDIATANYDAMKLIRTTVLTFPYTLKKIVSTKDNLTASRENLNWDLLTGTPTEILSKSSLGTYTKTVSVPAYKIYSQLGSKTYFSSLGARKNMLTQEGATYVYKSDPMGNPLGLISATVQTWSNNWSNYRTYTNGPNTPYEDEGSQTYMTWRKGPSYAYVGDYSKLQSDGSKLLIAPGDAFKYSGSNPMWQYLGEVKRFDHFGMPLEMVDMYGGSSKEVSNSVKIGYDNRMIIASALNAKYNEIAFSSAEDKLANISFFGGEVSMGNGALVNTPVHTGYNALSTTGHGFVFKSSEISSSKSYKASVWTNSTSGKIYYRLNNGSIDLVPSDQTISTAVAIPSMGNWYRIDWTIKNPSSNILEIGVKSGDGSTVVFDDFRFQPLDATMTCYVYVPLDYEFSVPYGTYSPSYTYELDNDNTFTKYEANEKGEVVKISRESVQYGVKTISDSKTNLKRSNP